MHIASDVIFALETLRNPEKAQILARFFKTNVGEYGHGDVFLGITVPAQRKIAQKFQEISREELSKLLQSSVHEHRFTALEILVMQFERASAREQKQIVAFYLAHTKWINNWDLVDTSAPYILGAYLVHEKDRSILLKLATSTHLWERRIAIVSTYALIRTGRFEETLQISEQLLSDSHDLIHKAVGWMLREVGKKDAEVLRTFLATHAHTMPRTMLRYAIEKFGKEERERWMGR